MASNLAIALTIGASVGSAIAGLTRVKNSIQTIRDQSLSTRQKLTSLGKTTAVGITGTVSGLKAMSGVAMGLADPAIKFESAMADVKKVVDFETPEGFKKLSNEILDLTRTIPMTGEELAAITASGGQLGVAEQDLKAFTTTIAKMSTAFDMTAEVSGDAMAKVANVYKIPIKNIGNLGDAINELSNSSPAKASDIVNTLGRIGGTAKQFGLSENAAAALSNSFISLGKAPEVAGTAINGMLTKLMTAEKGGKAFQAALKTVGISAKELKASIAKDGESALVDFLKKLEKVPKEQQMGVLVDLFGLQYADDVAVLAGNLGVLEQSLNTLKETDENGKAKYLGSMEKEFNARAATTENGLKLLQNSSNEFFVVLGNRLLPIIGKVASALSQFVQGITDFAKENETIIDVLIYVGGAIAGVITGFSALSATFGVIGMGWVAVSTGAIKFMSGIKKVWNWIRPLGNLLLRFGGIIWQVATLFSKAMLFMARALLTNPIGLTITAIAVSAYLIYENWGAVSQWFANLWANVTTYFNQFCQWVQGIWSGVSGWVAQAWDGILSYFSNLWTNIGSFFDNGITTLGNTILNFNPLSLFQSIFTTVMNWFGFDLPNTFSQFGQNIIDGLVNGIRNAWNLAKEKVSELGSGIKNWFTEKLGIRSPSRVFKGYGINIVEGLVIGVDKQQAQAQNATLTLGNTMREAMPKSLPTPELATPSFNPVFADFRPKLTTNQREKMGLWEGLGGMGQSIKQAIGVFFPSLLAASNTSENDLLNAYQSLSRESIKPSSSNSGIVVNFNPTINVSGSGQSIENQLMQGLQMSLYEFEQLLNRVLDQRQRRAY